MAGLTEVTGDGEKVPAVIAGSLAAAIASYSYGRSKGRWASETMLSQPGVPPQGPAVAISKFQQETVAEVFGAAAVEEAIFRALLLETVVAIGYPSAGLVGSSVLFGVGHSGSTGRKIDAILGGLAYGSVYLLGRAADGPLLGWILATLVHGLHNLGTRHGAVAAAEEIAQSHGWPTSLGEFTVRGRAV